MSVASTIKELIKQVIESANAGSGPVYKNALYITDIPTLEQYIPEEGPAKLAAATFISRGTSSAMDFDDEADGNRYAIGYEEPYLIEVLRGYAFEAASSEDMIDSTWEAIRNIFDTDPARALFRDAGYSYDTPTSAEFNAVDYRGMGRLYSAVKFILTVRDLA
jgi:hypothetical protein